MNNIIEEYVYELYERCYMFVMAYMSDVADY